MNDKAIEYKSLIDKIRVMIANVSKLGIDITKYNNRLDQIIYDVENNAKQSKGQEMAVAFLTLDYTNGIKELKKLEYALRGYEVYTVSYNVCKYIDMRILKFTDVDSVREYSNKMIDVLRKIGVNIKDNKDNLIVSKGNNYTGIDVIVAPYPGFPTDLQQPLTVLLSICDGVSSIKETIYPASLSHVDSLNGMNASICIDGDVIKIKGKRSFVGKSVSGKDLRGGISLVVAALLARGESYIEGVKYIKRGYSDLVYKLRKLGANIAVERINEDE